MAENSAGTLGGHLHFYERFALHAVDVVDAGESLVHEGVVGSEQFGDGPVLAHDVGEKQLRLPLHRERKITAPVAESFWVGLDGKQVPRLQPLADEVVDERFGAFVFQHSQDLRVHIFAQRPGLRLAEEFAIRHRAPKEIREPRRQRPLVHRVRGFWVIRLRLEFPAKQKMW